MILRLFGYFDLQVASRRAPPVRYRKSHWLLALLVLHHGRELDRDWLSGLLWPDSSGSQSLYNLRRSLAELRRVLGPEGPRLDASTPHTLALDLTGAQIDVVTFDAAIACGGAAERSEVVVASLESAVELYRGPLLQGCYEEWISPERGAREEAYLKALETLAAHAAARDDPAAAARLLRQAVSGDPFRETAQQALLQALMASGDAIGALLAYRAFRLRLHQEIGAAPSPETKALFHQLRARARGRAGVSGVGSDGRHPTPDTLHPTPVPAAPRRLPRPLSPFVGRETALQAVAACLESARLVTLTGPGGVGKTRLAIQVADAIADDHLHGVWFVDLARFSEPGLVPQAVASVLAVPEQPDRPLAETLAEFLGSKQLLLVLDNCEHLLEACAALVEALLSSSAELRVLATSRQSLGLAGEVAWQLPGLSIPPPTLATAGPVTEALLHFEAVRLFVVRARGAASAFSLTECSARSVGEICRRLEGIPLAIELAAARVKVLAVEEIAARLDDSFRLLTGGSRTAAPRHQTLRATMDWSYALLSPPERLLLRRLSVFAGSFSLKAAEAVAGGQEPAAGDAGPSSIGLPTGHWPLPTHVLDLLTQLVDQSLVIVERPEERQQVSPVIETGTRYRLLETVRQYALERLRAGDGGVRAPLTLPAGAGAERRPGQGHPAPGASGESEEERARRRHLEFYLRLAEKAAPHVWGPDQAAWLELLDTEIDNLRAAMDWALGTATGYPLAGVAAPGAEQALRMATALMAFWDQYRHLEEGRQRLAVALEAAGPARHTPAGAWALFHLGLLAYLGDDMAAAPAFFEESLAVQRGLADPKGIASGLWGLGHVARRRGEYTEARALHEESLAIRRALGGQYDIAISLIALADTLREQGEDPSAWAVYYGEALAIRRELGDRPGVAGALGELANVARRRGDYARARQYREECLTLRRALGSRLGVIHSLGALGHLARDQGEFEDARAFYTESLHLRRELGDRYTLIQALEDFAELAAAEGKWVRMTRLLGAAEALREGMGKPLGPRERGEYDRYLNRARPELGEEATAAAREAGRAMTLQQATGFALEPAAP